MGFEGLRFRGSKGNFEPLFSHKLTRLIIIIIIIIKTNIIIVLTNIVMIVLTAVLISTGGGFGNHTWIGGSGTLASSYFRQF